MGRSGEGCLRPGPRWGEERAARPGPARERWPRCCRTAARRGARSREAAPGEGGWGRRRGLWATPAPRRVWSVRGGTEPRCGAAGRLPSEAGHGGSPWPGLGAFCVSALVWHTAVSDPSPASREARFKIGICVSAASLALSLRPAALWAAPLQLGRQEAISESCHPIPGCLNASERSQRGYKLEGAIQVSFFSLRCLFLCLFTLMANKIPYLNGSANRLSQLIKACICNLAVSNIMTCLLPWNCESYVKTHVKLVSAYWLMVSASRRVLQHLIW